MLSFLRDSQETNQAPASKAQGPADPSAQASASEYLTVAGKTQKARQSTFVVAALFVVGLAVLGVMVKKCQFKPAAAAAATARSEDTQIEAAISRLTGVSAEMNTRMDQIVQKFHEFSAVVQVAVNELAKNPFELEAARSQEVPTTVTPPPLLPTSPATQVEVHMQPSAPTPAAQAAAPEANLADAEAARRRDVEQAKLQEEARRAAAEENQRRAAAETARQQYQQQVTRKAGELKLQSILQSTAGACCLINDTLVRVGDRVKGFQVTQISDNSVHLLWSEPAMPEMTIVLKLTE
jgi:type IV secretory pathway VirB10-like protein